METEPQNKHMKDSWYITHRDGSHGRTPLFLCVTVIMINDFIQYACKNWRRKLRHKHQRKLRENLEPRKRGGDTEEQPKIVVGCIGDGRLRSHRVPNLPFLPRRRPRRWRTPASTPNLRPPGAPRLIEHGTRRHTSKVACSFHRLAITPE